MSYIFLGYIIDTLLQNNDSYIYVYSFIYLIYIYSYTHTHTHTYLLSMSLSWFLSLCFLSPIRLFFLQYPTANFSILGLKGKSFIPKFVSFQNFKIHCLIMIPFIHPIKIFWTLLWNFLLINSSLYFHQCSVSLSLSLCWRSLNHIQGLLRWFSSRTCRTWDTMVLTAKIYYNAESAKGKGTWDKVQIKPGESSWDSAPCGSHGTHLISSALNCDSIFGMLSTRKAHEKLNA